jgi:hypothetical protein
LRASEEQKSNANPLLDKLEEIFEKNPELIEKMVYAAVMKAVEGDFRYFCEIRDMLDGKPVQEHCGPNGEPIPVKLINGRGPDRSRERRYKDLGSVIVTRR